MDDEQTERTQKERAQTATTLLLAGSVLVTLALLASMALGRTALSAHLPYVGTLLSHLLALVLIARDRPRTGICVFAVSYLGVMGGEILRSGVSAPLAYVALPIVIFVGLTWSGPAAAGMAATASLLLLTGVLLQDAGVLPTSAPEEPFGVWLTATVCLLITATMIWVATRVLSRSRAAATAHEEARRSLEHRLNQAQRLESVGRLAAGVAHDFNNVLTVVFAEASRLAATQKAARSSAENILAAAERAAALTRQLLAFGRRGEAQPATFDLNDTVRDLHHLLSRFMGEGIQFELELGADPFWVRADTTEIEQILLNLVTNARDAMPQGGKLTLRTERASQAQLATCVPPWSGADSAVALSVIDTGVGMDKTLRQRLFEPFFTTKDVGKGSGLGLSTVREIVKNLGGCVFVDSEPGRGSTFTVILPSSLESPTWAPIKTQPPEDSHELQQAHVLVVDDDDQVRGSIASALRAAGSMVHVARSGEEALILLGEGNMRFDLIVTDVVMTGMSGPELAKRARQLDPRQPILFVSGYAEERLREERKAVVGAELLRKPFRTPQLLASVRRSLRSRDQRGASSR